jgi:hypothetical protein
VNSAGENRAKFCKALDGKLLCSALYGIHMVTLIDLKTVSAHAKHSGAVNKTSSESKAQDDNFWEVKKHKRHNSSDTSQSAKKSTKTVPTSATVKLPPKQCQLTTSSCLSELLT